MAFLKLFVLVMALVLLPGCDTTQRVSGEITQYHTDAEDRLIGLTIRTDEGESLTFVPEEEEAHRIVFWLGADTLTEIQEKFPDAVLVNVQHEGKKSALTQPDGTQLPAIVAEWVIDTAHLETEKAYTFSDGTSADLWDEWPAYAYRLEDRTALLRVGHPGSLESSLSANGSTPAAQEKLLAFYEAQGLLYDEQAELEKAYSFYQQDPENFKALHVEQNVSAAFFNENIISIRTTVVLPVSPGYIEEFSLCHTFDRKTGEQISNYDLFTVPQEEILPLILSYTTYENWENAPAMEEMQAALRPEYIFLSDQHINITFPAGTLPSQQHSYGFGVSLFGQSWDALQPWAQPEA